MIDSSATAEQTPHLAATVYEITNVQPDKARKVSDWGESKIAPKDVPDAGPDNLWYKLRFIPGRDESGQPRYHSQDSSGEADPVVSGVKFPRESRFGDAIWVAHHIGGLTIDHSLTTKQSIGVIKASVNQPPQGLYIDMGVIAQSIVDLNSVDYQK
jgi:hypothetical protein